MRVGSLVVCVPLHNELRRRGAFVLRRTLDSLRRSRAFLLERRPDMQVEAAFCDDASDDGTANAVMEYLAGEAWIRVVRHAAPLGPGPARNTAAAQSAADIVCFLDADDQYHDRHLWTGVDFLENARSADGEPYAVVSTAAAVSTHVHPQWERRISRTIPITKFVRRAAWEFVEGMPTLAVYKRLTCEDQCLMRKLGEFFDVAHLPEPTVTYWNYPGSALDRQIQKFRRPPSAYDPRRDDPAELQYAAGLMIAHERAFLDYLRGKAREPSCGFAALPFARRPAPQPAVSVSS